MSVKNCVTCKHSDMLEFNEPCASCDHCSNWEDLAPQWISVEDRLPEEPCVVLVALHGTAVCVAWYHNEQFEIGSGMHFSVGCGVTHWLPIPELPKEV